MRGDAIHFNVAAFKKGLAGKVHPGEGRKTKLVSMQPISDNNETKQPKNRGGDRCNGETRS